MEVEVLVMGVVVGVRDLDEGDAGLEQAAGQQAVPAEVVLAVAIADARRFAAEVEEAAPGS